MPQDAPSLAMNAIMNKDRAAWLACFTDDAVLRDPVGGSPLDPEAKGLVGKDALGRFWDAVVEPAGGFHFHVRDEFVSGTSVARVATVEIERGPGRTLKYDGVFVYDMDGSGRIAHLHGYFEWPT